MASLQDTLQLNNQAVVLHHSDNLAQAAKAYHESLSFFKRLLKECYHHNQGIALSTVTQYECFHTAAPTNAQRDVSTQSDDEPFVYQSALILQETQSYLHNTQAMTIYCAGVVFNTAILHHRQAIKTGSSASLDRAAKLYEASLQLVLGQHIPAGSNSTVSLIAMAASNNLAQIELEKGLVCQACRRLQFLKILIQSLQHIVTRIFTMDEFQGMLSNTLSAESVTASPAA
ncbi:unnamed protein product [Cylindrotheca closterium]|uniref:Uncharacterized protein n=1 Tax=Cylindrotheca closterium TaxID=2856 RepID=A0AAD2PU91_9STRA|nr:unnamed protein product [Cylindrotheca closterium]